MVRLNHYHNHVKTAALKAVAFLSLCQLNDLYAGVLPIYNPLQENVVKVGLNVQSITANNAVTLESIFKHAETDLASKSGRYTAIASGRADAGIQYKQFGYIGYTYRSDVLISPSNDAMQFSYLAKFKKDIPQNRKYNIDVYAEEYITYGLTYSNAFTLYHGDYGSVHLGLGASFVIARDGQVATLNGSATSLGNKDYAFEAELQYAYNRNLLYDYDVNSYEGYGFNTYFALRYRYQNFDVIFIANDVASKIYWDKLAYSSITASSDNKEYDDEGYPIYQPAIRGKEGYRSYVQNVSSRYRLDSNYRFNAFNFNIGLDYYYDVVLPYTQVEYEFLKDTCLSLSYESYFKMVGMGLRYKTLAIEIKSDDLYTPMAISATITAAYVF